MIISHRDYDKKGNFVHIFWEKIDFFHFFCKNFHIFRQKIRLLHKDIHFLFHIFYFSEQKKIKCGTNWEGEVNYFSFDTKFIDLKIKILSEFTSNSCKKSSQNDSPKNKKKQEKKWKNKKKKKEENRQKKNEKIRKKKWKNKKKKMKK